MREGQLTGERERAQARARSKERESRDECDIACYFLWEQSYRLGCGLVAKLAGLPACAHGPLVSGTSEERGNGVAIETNILSQQRLDL